MKIVSLTVEGIKRVSVVRIDPTGNMVEITGKNGAGKTSVLDAIWWALAGKDAIQVQPIREGEERARIVVDLGELEVTRTFTRQPGGGFTTGLKVVQADKSKPAEPQRLLNSFVSALTFDPLAFMRSRPEEQARVLRSFVTDVDYVDFDSVEAANKMDFYARTEQNRIEKQKRAEAGAEVQDGTPDEPIDTQALLDEIAAAQASNAERQRLIDAKATANERLKERETRISALLDEIKEKRALVAELKKAQEELCSRIKNAPVAPEEVDIAPLREKLASAEATNRSVELKRRRAALLADAAAAKAESERLTNAMEARKRRVAKAIASAKLPVEGLGIDAGMVTWNGKPLEQASDAEQLRISMAIAMRLSPELRVVRVRDGSLLDEDSLKAVAQMADEHDCQVWIERVDTSGEVGFVMEDGHLRGVSPERAAEIAAIKDEDIDTSDIPEQTITPDGAVERVEPNSVDDLFKGD